MPLPLIAGVIAKKVIAGKIAEKATSAFKRNLKPVPEDKKETVGTFPKDVRAKMGFMRMKDGSEAPDGPAKGFPRFCGGKSKPYKK